MSIATAPAITAPGDSYARIRQPRVISAIRIVGAGICVLWLVLDIWNIPAMYQAWNQLLNTNSLHYGPVLLQWRIAPEAVSVLMTALNSLQALLYVAVALLIIWKRPFDPVAILLTVALLGEAIMFPQADQPVLHMLYNVAMFIADGVIFPIICVFPNGKFVPRWLRWLIWPYFAFVLIDTFLPLYEIDSRLPVIIYFVFALFWCIGLWFQVQRLRKSSNPVERQQLKLILSGMMVAVACAIINAVLWGLVWPNTDNAATKLLINLVGVVLFDGGLIVLLVTLALAIFRRRLWNIDLAINRGLVYGGLTIGLAAVFFLVLAVLQSAIQSVLGTQQTTIAAMISAGSIVALFNPVRLRLQRVVDRRVFKLRFDLNQIKDPEKPDGPGKQAAPGSPDGLIGKRLGAYTVEKLLGEGGMGQIYLGEQTALARKVAIKTLPTRLSSEATFRARFEREAHIAASLHHANIINVFDYGESEGTFFIVMEYIEGDDCENALRKQKIFSIEQTIPMIHKLASALDYAHERGLVHRDIKPANIMLRGYVDTLEGVEPILTDFGLAKLVDSHSGLTQAGAVGTIAYMAPEQIMAAGSVDHRADIYAFGVMCYELLTGRLPFPSDNMAQLVFAHLQQPPLDPQYVRPDLPRQVAEALLWALEKSPEMRPQSAGAFAARLTLVPLAEPQMIQVIG